VLTSEEVKELVESFTKEEDEETEAENKAEPAMWTLPKFAEVF